MMAEIVDNDLFNGLHDDLLCYILRFLSLRDAARTRILCRRWRCLSSSSFDLRFDTDSVLGIDYNMFSSYLEFYRMYRVIKPPFLIGVGQILRSYTNRRIDSFHVCFGLKRDSASHLDAWIAFALRLNTVTISLDLTYGTNGPELLYDFPCHLLPIGQPSSLKHMYLEQCNFSPSPAQRFVSLRTIHIDRARLDQPNIDNIRSSCINLEQLTLQSCVLPSYISGPMPHLVSLLILHCSLIGFENGNDNGRFFELNSLEKLKSFEFIGYETKLKFFKLPALENLNLKSTWDESNVAMPYEFLYLPKLTNLSLGFRGLELFHPPQRMDRFKHLKQLEFYATLQMSYDLLPIVSILNASPALQKLHLSLFCWNFDGFQNSERMSEFENPHLQLKEVKLSAVIYRSIHPTLVRFLFRNCVALELMTVNIQAEIYGGDGEWRHYDADDCTPKREVVFDTLQRLRGHSRAEIVVTSSERN